MIIYKNKKIRLNISIGLFTSSTIRRIPNYNEFNVKQLVFIGGAYIKNNPLYENNTTLTFIFLFIKFGLVLKNG